MYTVRKKVYDVTDEYMKEEKNPSIVGMLLSPVGCSLDVRILYRLYRHRLVSLEDGVARDRVPVRQHFHLFIRWTSTLGGC